MPCYQYYAEQLSTMIFCSFEARYRVINSLFKCLIPRRGRHWSLSSRTLIDRPSSSEANILLSSSQNRFVCLDLTHSHITRRCVAVFCKESQFSVYKLSTYPFHTQWSCMHCKIIYVHAAWKSDVLQYNFHLAWTEMIRRKMRVRLVRSKGNVWLSTSSNFASISPLSGVFNLLCNGEGKEASVKVSD